MYFSAFHQKSLIYSLLCQLHRFKVAVQDLSSGQCLPRDGQMTATITRHVTHLSMLLNVNHKPTVMFKHGNAIKLIGLALICQHLLLQVCRKQRL